MADKKYELTFGMSDGSSQKVSFTVPAGENGKSAYEYAVAGGYTGSEEEFAAKLAQDTPTGGGVQPDYTQHDASAPDYIKNRIAYPAWSPVLYAEKVYVNDYDWTTDPDTVPSGTYTAPEVGKRYTFGIKDKIYSGIAVSGEFDIGGEMITGIGIVDEQNGITYAFYVEVMGEQLWYFAFAEPVPTEENEAYVIVVEGDNPYNKLSVPDDVTFGAEGMNVVFEFKNLNESSNRYIAEALINDVEFVIDADGVESVLTVDDLTVLGDADSLQSMQGVIYLLKGTETAVAMIADLGETGETFSVILIDEQAATGSGITVKSIKVNLPGIFAPTIPAKKIPAECLPDNVPGSYVVRLPADTPFELIKNPAGNAELRAIVAESYDNFAQILYNGGRVMIDASAVDLGTGALFQTVLLTSWGMYGDTLVGAAVAADNTGAFVVYSFYFPNGTWTPPTTT